MTPTTAVPVLSYRGGGGVSVDVDALVRGRMLIQANSGGGKSWALRQLLEETFGIVQHLILDPEGEFSTLRERFDYVLAAPHGGDVEASPRTAKVLCRRLMETSASAVLDLYDLKPYDRREFARIFLTELLALPKELRRPVLVVLDEAHTFAPEGGKSEALEAVVTLAAQGRKRGYALVCATQRLSKLSKDVAAELNTKLVGRTGLDLDVKRAGDELAMDKEGRAALPTLEPGTFYAYGPALPPGPPRLVRTGAVKTSHPEVGEMAPPAPPPSKKVKSLLAAALADLPQQAEEEARTIDEFKRQNADLSRKLRHAEKSAIEKIVERKVVDQVSIDRAVREAVAGARARQQELLKSVRSVARSLTRTTAALQAGVAELEPIAVAVARIPDEATATVESADTATTTHVATRAASAPITRYAAAAAEPRTREPRPRAESEPAEGVTRPQQRMLDALASFLALGIRSVQKHNVAVFSDQSPRSSGFANNLGRLRALGFIDYPSGGEVCLTDAGSAIAHAESIDSLVALHDAWERKLPRPQWAIVAALIRVHPDALERDALASEAGQSPTSSGYANNLGALRGLGLIDYRPGKLVYVTDLLYPEGLR